MKSQRTFFDSTFKIRVIYIILIYNYYIIYYIKRSIFYENALGENYNLFNCFKLVFKFSTEFL
jgi:hypothetical protein